MTGQQLAERTLSLPFRLAHAGIRQRLRNVAALLRELDAAFQKQAVFLVSGEIEGFVE